MSNMTDFLLTIAVIFAVSGALHIWQWLSYRRVENKAVMDWLAADKKRQQEESEYL